MAVTFPKQCQTGYDEGTKSEDQAEASRMRRERGFTLVELLVVIAIIGVLVSLLLPAVQAARESGRRTQCQNNLKQIALAVQNYEAQQKTLPAAGIVNLHPQYGTFEPQTGPMFSWLVLLLPFLEQPALHAEFDFSVSVLQQPRAPFSAQPATLLCPSDSARGRQFQHSSLTQGKSFGKGNYAAYVSPYHVDLQTHYPGALVGPRPHRLASVVDGLSHSILSAEIRTREHPLDQRGAWALPWTGSSLLAFDMHHLDGASNAYQGHPLSVPFVQRPNNTRNPIDDMLYDCPEPARAQLEKLPCAIYSPQEMNVLHFLSAAPRSFHPGIVNGAWLDGHVAVVSNNVDPYVMAYTISVNDGHPVSDEP
jgi:prepilin-type N-terminal cleavage/methylation domain-containing protein/prepilin-type processing-associated H-X9-DG protein